RPAHPAGAARSIPNRHARHRPRLAELADPWRSRGTATKDRRQPGLQPGLASPDARENNRGCVRGWCARPVADTAWDGRRACDCPHRPPGSRPRRMARRSFAELIEGFALFDHAQLLAGAFFHGFHALLELHHLGFEDAIAFQQALVLALLFGYLTVQPADLGHAALAHPEAILKATQ